MDGCVQPQELDQVQNDTMKIEGSISSRSVDSGSPRPNRMQSVSPIALEASYEETADRYSAGFGERDPTSVIGVVKKSDKNFAITVPDIIIDLEAKITDDSMVLSVSDVRDLTSLTSVISNILSAGMEDEESEAISTIHQMTVVRDQGFSSGMEGDNNRKDHMSSAQIESDDNEPRSPLKATEPPPTAFNMQFTESGLAEDNNEAPTRPVAASETTSDRVGVGKNVLAKLEGSSASSAAAIHNMSLATDEAIQKEYPMTSATKIVNKMVGVVDADETVMKEGEKLSDSDETTFKKLLITEPKMPALFVDAGKEQTKASGVLLHEATDGKDDPELLGE